MRAFHFLIAHGSAAPFTLVPLARHFDPADPRDPGTVAEQLVIGMSPGAERLLRSPL